MNLMNASGRFALSAYRTKWRCPDLSHGSGSDLKRLQLVQIAGQPPFAQFQAVPAAGALQLTQTLLHVVPVEPGKQICKNMPNGELSAFELEGGPFQAIDTVISFHSHNYRFSNRMNNFVRWRPRLFLPSV
ncbi:hypothetical protein [Novosphingobium sp. ZW T3_23]|uniref:hypothetical protein n=1 Tax=Novosphingobium sp. ZW T3_23 TaxID=3378084 RepID=UPI003851BD0C